MIRDGRELRESIGESVTDQERSQRDVKSVGSGFDEIGVVDDGSDIGDVGSGVRFSSDLRTTFFRSPRQWEEKSLRGIPIWQIWGICDRRAA